MWVATAKGASIRQEMSIGGGQSTAIYEEVSCMKVEERPVPSMKSAAIKKGGGGHMAAAAKSDDVLMVPTSTEDVLRGFMESFQSLGLAAFQPGVVMDGPKELLPEVRLLRHLAVTSTITTTTTWCMPSSKCSKDTDAHGSSSSNGSHRSPSEQSPPSSASAAVGGAPLAGLMHSMETLLLLLLKQQYPGGHGEAQGHEEGKSEEPSPPTASIAGVPLWGPDAMPPPYPPARRRALLIVRLAVDALRVMDKARRDGFTVDVARTALGGLALAAVRHFDVVISEVAFPMVDGMEMVRRLRRFENDGEFHRRRPQNEARGAFVVLVRNGVGAVNGFEATALRAGADHFVESYDDVRFSSLHDLLDEVQSEPRPPTMAVSTKQPALPIPPLTTTIPTPTSASSLSPPPPPPPNTAASTPVGRPTEPIMLPSPSLPPAPTASSKQRVPSPLATVLLTNAHPVVSPNPFAPANMPLMSPPPIMVNLPLPVPTPPPMPPPTAAATSDLHSKHQCRPAESPLLGGSSSAAARLGGKGTTKCSTSDGGVPPSSRKRAAGPTSSMAAAANAADGNDGPKIRRACAYCHAKKVSCSCTRPCKRCLELKVPCTDYQPRLRGKRPRSSSITSEQPMTKKQHRPMALHSSPAMEGGELLAPLSGPSSAFRRPMGPIIKSSPPPTMATAALAGGHHFTFDQQHAPSSPSFAPLDRSPMAAPGRADHQAHLPLLPPPPPALQPATLVFNTSTMTEYGPPPFPLVMGSSPPRMPRPQIPSSSSTLSSLSGSLEGMPLAHYHFHHRSNIANHDHHQQPSAPFHLRQHAPEQQQQQPSWPRLQGYAPPPPVDMLQEDMEEEETGGNKAAPTSSLFRTASEQNFFLTMPRRQQELRNNGQGGGGGGRGDGRVPQGQQQPVESFVSVFEEQVFI